ILPIVKTGAVAILWTVILGWLIPQAMLVSQFNWHAWKLGPLRLVAVVPLVLGILMGYSSLWNFATVGQGTPVPIDPPKHLVVAGFYRFVRNPIYVGVGLIVISEALLLNTLSFRLLLVVAAFWLWAHLFVVLYEERTLRKKFGVEYEEYLKQVPRWIPRFRGK